MILIVHIVISLLLAAGFPNITEAGDAVARFLDKRAVPLSSFRDFTPFLEGADTKKLVLLGEASHGTSEYYTWRTDISKYLIQQMNYDFIAVEADWPSAFAVNRYVKNLPGAAETATQAMTAFVRWPHWMWKNQEVLALVEWLRQYNDELPMQDRVGFYGVDLQNKQKSMNAVLRILENEDPGLHRFARQQYECLLRFDEPIGYLRMVADTRKDCSDNLEAVYQKISQNLETIAAHEQFNLYHNAKLVVHAEQNLRSNLVSGPDSWNIRARHFQYTADALLMHYGGPQRNARGVVWAHNTHIGDASATQMKSAGLVNIGQLAREAYGTKKVLAIGLGAYTGEVLAGRRWGAEKERMQLPEAPPGTWEYIAMNTGHPIFAVSFEDAPMILRTRAMGNRAVGVTYEPENDRRNYVLSLMANRYDIFLFFRETSGLSPLGF